MKDNRPIILVAAEATKDDKYNWDDTVGEKHHYPNVYRNKITPGREFIYYRTSLTKDGRQAPAGYFGTGKIGSVYLDPKTTDVDLKRKRNWYCDIIDYKELYLQEISMVVYLSQLIIIVGGER